MFILWLFASAIILDITSSQFFQLPSVGQGTSCCARGVTTACSFSNPRYLRYCGFIGSLRCRSCRPDSFNCCRSVAYGICSSTRIVPVEKKEKCIASAYKTCESDCTLNCCQKVVSDRCTAQKGGIPTNVTVPCKEIGYNLCTQTGCSFESIKNVTNPTYNQNNCCRGVITNLCDGAPGEITLPNGSTVNVRQKCLTAGYESCLKTHTCSWSCSQKVLTELCSGNYNCLRNAQKFADSTLSLCSEKGILEICQKSVDQLCESGSVPYNADICKAIGRYLCQRN